MHARVTTTAIGPDETDSVAEIFQQVLPAMRDLEGYVGFVVLTDPDDQRLLVVSLWETAEAMAASESVADRIKDAETAQRDFEIQETSRYRVVTFDLAN
jgi:heme-degrading monooxygenase HmoA